MRKVILSMMVSLDGSIAGPGDNLEWFRTDEDFEEEMLGLLGSVDAMLFGRVAYEMLGAYWPGAGADSSSDAPGGFTSKARQIEFARLMNTLPKIVYSRTLAKADWTPVRVVRDNVAEDLTRMKQEPGKDLVLFAGADIATTFTNLDLFDEYRLMVHPIVIGRGLPLFKGVTADRELRLVRSRTFSSGVVLLQYERDRSRA